MQTYLDDNHFQVFKVLFISEVKQVQSCRAGIMTMFGRIEKVYFGGLLSFY